MIQNSPHRAACAAINVPAIITDWCVRVRSAASSSALASDVLAASAPLLQSEDAKTRIRAADACREAVLALAVVERQAKEETATHETLKRLYPHDVPVIVSEAETPKKLLPRVHALWPHLVMSLGHRLGPAVKPDALKASLELLIATATASKGGFIARRVASELWPWLRRVIDRGVAHVGGLGGEFGGVASSRLDPPLPASPSPRPKTSSTANAAAVVHRNCVAEARRRAHRGRRRGGGVVFRREGRRGRVG